MIKKWFIKHNWRILDAVYLSYDFLIHFQSNLCNLK